MEYEKRGVCIIAKDNRKEGIIKDNRGVPILKLIKDSDGYFRWEYIHNPDLLPDYIYKSNIEDMERARRERYEKQRRAEQNRWYKIVKRIVPFI